MPGRTSNLALPQHNSSPTHDYREPTSSSQPQKKNKMREYATKAKEKYQRNNPKNSLRKLEKSATKIKNLFIIKF